MKNISYYRLVRALAVDITLPRIIKLPRGLTVRFSHEKKRDLSEHLFVSPRARTSLFIVRFPARRAERTGEREKGNFLRFPVPYAILRHTALSQLAACRIRVIARTSAD